MSEYQMIVIVKRNREKDENTYGKSDVELMIGLAGELSDGWDQCAISGSFQVQCVIKEIN